MEAMEKAIEENHKAMELRSSSIEGMIQKLAAAWEKKSPTTNVHTQLTSNRGKDCIIMVVLSTPKTEYKMSLRSHHPPLLNFLSNP